MSTKERRLLELDGLRGFAAFTVFLSHAVGLYPDSSLLASLQASPLHILWDGAAAVFLFFTLSGFVLALPFLTSGRKLDYPSFLIRRVFRLYPAFWFALVAALFMRQLFDPSGMTGLSDWARSMWITPVTLKEVLRHLTMVLHGDAHVINPPVWSLATEMRASVVLPFFIVWLMYWRTSLSQVLLLAAAVLAMQLSNGLGYLAVFIVGVLAAVNFPAWKDAFLRVPAPCRPLLWCLALVVYGSQYILPFAVPQVIVPYLIAIATVIMIFLAVTGKRSKSLLQSRVGIFLGETSYSFYLLHFPVLWLTTSYLFPATGSIVLCSAIAAVSTYLISFLAYRWMEVPLHELGRDLSQRLRAPRKLKQAAD